MTAETGPWTCESCGTENQDDDEHCQQCDRWRTDEYGPDDCVDGRGNIHPEHDYGEYECRRCGAETPEEDE